MSGSNDTPPVNITTKTKAGAPKTDVKDAATPPSAETTVQAPETKVETPAAPAAPAAPTPTPAPQAPVLSREAEQIQHLLSAYKGVMGNVIVNAQAQVQGLQYFLRASTIAVSAPNDDARDVLYNFYMDEKDGLMTEEAAMRQINTLSRASASLLMTTYTLYRHKTLGDAMPFNPNQAMEKTSRVFVTYIQNKR